MESEERPKVISSLSYAPKIAYFSMEICVEADIPSYSGGLGVLAGDTLRTFADLNIPAVGVTLLSEKGYLYQELTEDGQQVEKPYPFDPRKRLILIAKDTTVKINGNEVKIRPWCYFIRGVSGYKVPVIFLDTNLEENGEWERTLTSYLYGGDTDYRLAQEIILGIGGFRILKSLGFTSIYRFHMNEGHASFLTLELYRRTKNVEFVRRQCVFTTHTPVKAGHDMFSMEKVKQFLGEFPDEISPYVTENNMLNMTRLGMFFSHYINGVAKKHREVSMSMFPHYSIDSITNGVHSLTWVSEPFQRLFDKYMPGWRQDPYILRSASGMPNEDVWNAHMEAKRRLIDFINEKFGENFSYDKFTIGFARRMTAYKRPYLLFYDRERLLKISEIAGGLQIVYSGKAHPKDTEGKEIIKRIISAGKNLKPKVNFIFIPNYDMNIAKMMVSGVDLWLNTPRIPMEASGTSGMKAAHNGVPQLSTLDGWWKEGYIEGVTGWAIGGEDQESDDLRDSRDMYDKLEYRIIPVFHRFRDRWIDIMKNCIALNASFFNTQRMVEQYVLNAYFL